MRLLRWVLLLLVALLSTSGCQAGERVVVRTGSPEPRFPLFQRPARYAPVPVPVFLVPSAAVPGGSAAITTGAAPTVTVERPQAYYLPAIPIPAAAADPPRKIKVEVDR